MAGEREQSGWIDTYQRGFLKEGIFRNSLGGDIAIFSVIKAAIDAISQGADEKAFFSLITGLILFGTVTINCLIEGREKSIQQNHEL